MALCAFAKSVWHSVSSQVGNCINFSDGFGTNNWLINNNYSLYISSIIAATSWFLWKARCEKIFKNINMHSHSIVCRALAYVKEYYMVPVKQFGKCLLLNNFFSADDPFLFISTTWNEVNLVSGFGFFIVNANYMILMAGSCSTIADSGVEANLKAIVLAVHVAAVNSFQVQNLFITNPEISIALTSNHFALNWRLYRWIHLIDRLSFWWAIFIYTLF